MLTVSVKEMLIVGSMAIVCVLLLGILLYYIADDDIQRNNVVYNNRYSAGFYVTIILLAIGIYIFINYIEVNKWYCNKICDVNKNCRIICELPINGFTRLLVTP
jgi:uncharacterized oligopeptide transporter (OPT) family protein